MKGDLLLLEQKMSIKSLQTMEMDSLLFHHHFHSNLNILVHQITQMAPVQFLNFDFIKINYHHFILMIFIKITLHLIKEIKTILQF